MTSIREVAFPARDDPSVCLSGMLFTPDNMRKELVVVLVHPWGFLGGSKANTFSYAEILAKKSGIQCLIFDSRGVGRSTGRSSFKCRAEVADVIGACDWVRENIGKPIVLVGSSAGAAVAGSALDQIPEAFAYVAVGYTFGWWSSLVLGEHYDAIMKTTKPKLFIMGTKDGFTTPAHLESRVKEMKGADMVLIDGVGHFLLETPTYAAQTCQYIINFIESVRI
jgi:alpha/beta superfamily hydrolase